MDHRPQEEWNWRGGHLSPPLKRESGGLQCRSGLEEAVPSLAEVLHSLAGLHIVVASCGGSCGVMPVAVLTGGYPHLGCGPPSRADPWEASTAGSVPQG